MKWIEASTSMLYLDIVNNGRGVEQQIAVSSLHLVIPKHSTPNSFQVDLLKFHYILPS